MSGLQQLAERCPGKVIFNGIDGVLPFGLQYGAHGGIGQPHAPLRLSSALEKASVLRAEGKVAVKNPASWATGTTYNVLPELYLEIDRLVRADECAAAIAVQKRANAANSGYKVVAGKQMQSVKQILIWQGVLEHASMAQADGLTEPEVAALREAVEANADLAATLVR